MVQSSFESLRLVATRTFPDGDWKTTRASPGFSADRRGRERAPSERPEPSPTKKTEIGLFVLSGVGPLASTDRAKAPRLASRNRDAPNRMRPCRNRSRNRRRQCSSHRPDRMDQHSGTRPCVRRERSGNSACTARSRPRPNTGNQTSHQGAPSTRGCTALRVPDSPLPLRERAEMRADRRKRGRRREDVNVAYAKRLEDEGNRVKRNRMAKSYNAHGRLIANRARSSQCQPTEGIHVWQNKRNVRYVAGHSRECRFRASAVSDPLDLSDRVRSAGSFAVNRRDAFSHDPRTVDGLLFTSGSCQSHVPGPAEARP